MVAFSTLLLIGCNIFSSENVTPDNKTIEKSELQKLYENTFNGNSIVINGDTVINQKEIQLHSSPTTTNIESIKNTNGTFKMVAIGGGLTAGARDGGLYRNGQLTSFPNLVAIQMKADFEQPLFAQNESNGYGYKVVSNVSNGIPKYKSVSNNIALLKSSPVVELNPYNGEINNWGIPYFGINDWNQQRVTAGQPMKFVELTNPYLSRVLMLNNTILDEVLKTKFDLIIIEPSIGNSLYAISSGLRSSWSPPSRLPHYVTIMQYAQSIGAKAVISNIPNVVDFPVFKLVDFNEIRKINKSELAIQEVAGSNMPIVGVQNGSIMYPNALADSLLNPNIQVSQKRGLSYKTPLLYNEVYTSDRVQSLQNTLEMQNNQILDYAQKNNCPVVDLYNLFKKVTSNSFITDDGIKVDKKAFFSTDGIYPTAFGQAIIANEYIKTINSFYKTNIPLIQTAYYLNK